jgi:hypothetical protein
MPTIEHVDGIVEDGITYYGTLYPTRDSII